jgi:hypothetical protein
MKNMMRKTVLIISFFNFVMAAAQEASYRYYDATQLWRTTGNAAGLSIDSVQNRGYAAFTLSHHDGSYRRVQEGGQRNALNFDTERYQTIGKYFVGYGRFAFDIARTKDRAWADVYRPYDATPYFAGSDVAGKYDQQSFAFTGALGTVALGHLRLGLRLDYQAGDLSRLRDPRSRSELLDYRLTPSVTYTLGRHTLGLAPYYDRRKEKIPNMTTVQNDPNLGYYEMRGLEQVNGSVGAYKGFSRQWVDHRLGGQLSWGYRGEGLAGLTTIGLERGSEEALEDELRMPGKYVDYRYTIESRHRIGDGRLLHEVDLQMGFEEAYGNEYAQQRVQTTDATTGVSSYHYETLIAYDKRYQMHRMDGSLSYRMNMTEQQQVTAYVGLSGQVSSAHQKQLLPTSTFDRNRFAVVAEGGKALLDRRLWVDLRAGYHFTGTGDDDLQLADPTSVYATQVLLPDMAWYTANYWQGRVELKYEMPVSFGQTRSLCYVKAYGDYLHTQHSHLTGRTVGISIGIFN